MKGSPYFDRKSMSLAAKIYMQTQSKYLRVDCCCGRYSGGIPIIVAPTRMEVSESVSPEQDMHFQT